MTTFDVEAFEAGLAKAVADKGGDYVYSSSSDIGMCWYTDRQDPEHHCLIGQALINAGHTYHRSWEDNLADGLLVALGAPGNVAEAARSAQVQQDIRNTWGEALDTYWKTLQAGESRVKVGS